MKHTQSAENKKPRSYPAQLQNEHKRRAYPDKQKLREFNAGRLAIQDILEGALQAESK